MSQTIEAIYEEGFFRPLQPVDLPEGTRVRIVTETSPISADEEIHRQLITDGASPEEAAKILNNFRLLWSSYDTLTGEQKESLEQSRLDQKHFFDHQPLP